jgi:serine protease Do
VGTARYVQSGTFDATLLQHDADISPGNSGGALVNINGELVGINNMKIADDNVSGIGFAIPSNTVARVAADLEDDGIISRPYLGISSYVQVNVCGLDYGVCVSVLPGGAADDAGLEDEDVIIGWKNITTGMTEFKDVMNFNDLREAILNSSVGDTVQLKYIRDGVEYISDETVLNLPPDDE